MPFYSFGSSRKISAASYIYYAQGCLHPDRVMQEHDFVYMLNGQWEIFQGREAFFMENDDVLILTPDSITSASGTASPGRRPYTSISAPDIRIPFNAARKHPPKARFFPL